MKIHTKIALAFVFLFSIITFKVYSQIKENKLVDTFPLNNASLSMHYYNKSYKQPTNKPQVDSNFWKETIIIQNDDNILTKEEFLNIDKSKLLYIKEVPLQRDSIISIKRIILLKIKST